MNVHGAKSEPDARTACSWATDDAGSLHGETEEVRPGRTVVVRVRPFQGLLSGRFGADLAWFAWFRGRRKGNRFGSRSAVRAASGTTRVAP